jgi:hypothetical protein
MLRAQSASRRRISISRSFCRSMTRRDIGFGVIRLPENSHEQVVFEFLCLDKRSRMASDDEGQQFWRISAVRWRWRWGSA